MNCCILGFSTQYSNYSTDAYTVDKYMKVQIVYFTRIYINVYSNSDSSLLHFH